MFLNLPSSGSTLRNGTYSFWGFQLESGSTATQFTTATGTIQGELAACQRYYWRNTPNLQYKPISPMGYAGSSTSFAVNFFNPVPMRIPPYTIDFANLYAHQVAPNAADATITSISFLFSDTFCALCSFNVASGLTTANYGVVNTALASGAYLGFGAEL